MDAFSSVSDSLPLRTASVVPYLRGQTVADYLDFMRQQHPHLADTLDLGTGALSEARAWCEPGEFDDNRGLGRGDSYRRAQRMDTVREAGVLRLLDLAIGGGGLDAGARFLDVLGGDGLIARVWNRVSGRSGPIPILTGDVSPQMTLAAVDYGLPAICQPAQRLLIRDGVMDGVILAYGTHHIERRDRPRAVAEACRVLRSGGRLVLHDFDEKSSVARWFSDVVDRYSAAGHRYEHFTPSEIERYFVEAGLTDMRLIHMYDPFIVTGDTPETALDRLLEYLVDMYGLRLLVKDARDRVAHEQLLALVRQCFLTDPTELPDDADDGAVSKLTVRRHDHHYVATLPRVALVATGVKP
ncbi:MAG: methyltransferase domain-containing protein [Actinomycetota bacterium]|nr:methyltransferase domain-containing protein [Actinomycetota bacterium]